MLSCYRNNDIQLQAGYSFLDGEADHDVRVKDCTQSVQAYPLKVKVAAGTTLNNSESLICGSLQTTVDWNSLKIGFLYIIA